MELSNAQRKLAAILSAGVQGYSRLMGEDEEATIRTLTLYRDVISALIQRHRGRVVDSPGDNLLAEFGSVVDALRCAVGIQQELRERNAHLPSHRQMNFRLGLNLGDVITEEERIYGDGVNIAARLERLAEGGGICISGTVYDQVEGKLPFFYESLGEQTVKNIARPVRVYRVASTAPHQEFNTGEPATGSTAQGSAFSILPIPDTRLLVPALVGRDGELTQLHERLEKAARGERQVVFVTGEPGIGKTTLVDAFLNRVRDRDDFRIAHGQCVEQYGAGDAYLPLLEAAHRLCRSPGGDRIIAALQQYAPTWLSQMPGILSPTEFAALQQRVQGFTHERMLREMAEAVEAHTTKRGLIVVLEDLHWSDTATLEWLAYTARRREPAKLLILGAYRPVEVLASGHPLRRVVQELHARGQCAEIELAPLAEEAVKAYLSRRFAAMTFPTDLLQTIYRRTGGNPLFVVNMVDYLTRQDVVVKEEGRWLVRKEKIGEVEKGVPETLRQLIERQIERLSEEEQRLLEVASVVGMEFTSAAVAAGLHVTADEVEEHCEKLGRKGQLIHEQGVEEWPDGTVGGRYRFFHALYQNVLYERIAPGRRVRLHKQVGERREVAFGSRAGEIATELAMHFEHGRDVRRAIFYLERAGKNALRLSANIEATHLLTRALTLVARLPASLERTRQELTLRLDLGTPMLALKGYGAPEVRQHYREAQALCRELGDPPELFPVLWGLWVSHAVAGELSAAEELGNQLLQFTQRIGDLDLSFQAHHALWTTLAARGDLKTCQFHVEEGLRFYQTERHYAQTFLYGGHDPGACCRIHGGFIYWLLGYPDRALQVSREAIALGKELSHPQTLTWALSGGAMVHQFCGEPALAQHCAEEAITLSTEQQVALWAAYSPAVRGWALVEQGKKEQGLEQIHVGLAALRATGTGLWQSQFLALLASAYQKTGQVQEGLDVVAEALGVVEHNGEYFYEAELYRMKGALTLDASVQGFGSASAAQAESKAEACFHKALEIARKQQAKSWELRASLSLARLWRQQEKLVEARELLENVYTWFTEGFATRDLQEAEALLVALGGIAKRTEHVRQKAEEEKQRARGQAQKANQEKRETGTKARIETEIELENSQLSSPSRQTPDARLSLADSALNPRSFGSTVPDTFRHEGEYWTLAFNGVVCRVRDMRGLHYLAQLLQHPNEEIPALRLASADLAIRQVQETGSEKQVNQEQSLSFSASDELLDPQARAAHKQRLEDLRIELEEASLLNDLGRIEKLQSELELLTQQLAQTFGLSGRGRRVDSSAERARTTVTKAIKNVLKKIHENHPTLGQYLTRTVKTGTFCSYSPDPRSSTSWIL